VSNEDDVRAMVAATVDQLGGLDIAVNNAAVLGRLGPALPMRREAARS
jgi:NAD(P)-dependent dehydrogenase (short-subunit alcohol dehydrogenase family)